MAEDTLILGISIGGWKGHTLTTALEEACRLKEKIGFSSVELWMERHSEDRAANLWPWEFNDRIISEAQSLLKEFLCKGVHLPFAFTNFAALNPRIREESLRQVEEGLDICGLLGAKYGVTHARFGTLEILPPAEEHKVFRDAFERLARRAGGHGVTLTIENGDTLHRLDDLVEVVEPLAAQGLGLTLDTGHANLFDGWGSFRNGAAFVREKGKLIKNIHLHDNHGEGDEHLVPGRGNIDFSSLFGALRETDCGPVITLEFDVTEVEYAQAAERVRAWWKL